MSHQLFTLEQANKMLPLVRSITINIVETWAELLQKRNEVADYERQKQPIPESLKEETNYWIDKINSYVKEIEDLGCFAEEFRRGVINFPSLFNGRKVFLNWYPQDKSVEYFHELDEAFQDRRLIKLGVFSLGGKKG